MPRPEPKRLIADDREGLEILSAAVQDAVLKPADLAYSAQERSFTLELNRFHWEIADCPPYFRSRSVLRFDSVVSVKARNISREGRDDEVYQLLAILVEEGRDSSELLKLSFSNDREIAIEAECIDVTLMDSDRIWPAKRRPDHDRTAD